ncbi:hypothetical protein F5Y10DRAFT_260279 [Nemania abortiva]|nr:hypothetical protein F5Y10DRAFT_260279 [Nemania abortiva]
MCNIYREVFSCGHAGQPRVSTRCGTGGGLECSAKRTDPVRQVSGKKCISCRRKDDQARRLFGDDADSGNIIFHHRQVVL